MYVGTEYFSAPMSGGKLLGVQSKLSLTALFIATQQSQQL